MQCNQCSIHIKFYQYLSEIFSLSLESERRNISSKQRAASVKCSAIMAALSMRLKYLENTFEGVYF